MKLLVNILLLGVIIGGIYFFLKKFTAYRCPKCHSRHMTKYKNTADNADGRYYRCVVCGHVVRTRF